MQMIRLIIYYAAISVRSAVDEKSDALEMKAFSEIRAKGNFLWFQKIREHY